MPSWTELERPRVGDKAVHSGAVLREQNLTAFKNNITYLRDINKVSYYHDGTGVDWTSTSTVITPIDDTKFRLSLTTQGGPVLAIFHGSFQRPTDFYMFFSIFREGDAVDNSEPNWPMYASTWKPLTFIKPFLDLPAGTHVFKPVWQCSGAGAAVALNAVTRPFFIVMESL